jgi:polar amino acid transport system substrate-binding protein
LLEHWPAIRQRLLGSAQASEATQRWPGATVLQFGSPTDMVLAIKTGKADAALSDGQPLKDILRQDSSLAILPQPLHRIPVGVGFNKENPALLTAFNAFLASIKRDGTYADMIDRWIEKGVYDMPELGSQPSGQVLTVGVSDGGMPFGGVVNNRWVGFDIEMAQRFANSQGKSLKIVSLEFGSLIAALVTGKVDLIAASIFITDERKQRINARNGSCSGGLRRRLGFLGIDGRKPAGRRRCTTTAKRSCNVNWPASIDLYHVGHILPERPLHSSTPER